MEDASSQIKAITGAKVTRELLSFFSRYSGDLPDKRISYDFDGQNVEVVVLFSQGDIVNATTSFSPLLRELGLGGLVVLGEDEYNSKILYDLNTKGVYVIDFDGYAKGTLHEYKVSESLEDFIRAIGLKK
jgi:hypothetical protein